MIEELKLVLDSLGDLSGVALWVVGAFIVYKLVIYLSTAGAFVYVAKLVVEKLHDWATSPKKPQLEAFTTNDLYGICITSDMTRKIVMRSLKKVRGKRTSIHSNYIHECSARWLEEAIEEKEQRDAEKSQ